MLRYGFVTYNQKIMIGIAIFMILSISDGALTLWGIRLGIIEEANPIMQWIMAKSTVGFMTIKLSIPIILGVVFWRIRRNSRKLVTYSLGVIVIVYTVVNMIHVYWLFVKG
ncbi:DUF5658 family protein [Desulfosporosinus nitroreducens]|uniref:DUF5658 family protein n=1 Tax=Desulfosporosinus nitroreducens TaxID=2018668 RepID=A0ABT8QP03_9FIRM|nr:DUF5658 family protein [Desulfosporosinus nitroreducens]MDO0823089.1 DUF5658 family protein [Desulfosporosinus nitroreducens]